MTIKYANDAKSTLASALTSSATSLSVANASSFPAISAGDEMYLTLADPLNSVNEIVKCTGVSGTTFTVVRGHESTTAVSWTAGSFVQLRVTAGLITNLLNDKATTTSVNNLSTVYDPIGTSVAMAIALGG